jgi:alpha-tubulin suppressor-like RCC1 family protein
VGNIRFEQLSAGARHTCGIVSGGQAYCWGDNRQGQLGDGTITTRGVPVPVLTELRFSSISAGARHTCAVALDGQGWCWGDNRQGQHGNGTLMSSVTPQEITSSPDFRLVSVTAGGSHSCGIHVTGTGFCWGAGQFGQLGNGVTFLVAIPSGVAHARFTEIIAGAGHSCGVSDGQRVLCWGLNAYGQLGAGDFVDRSVVNSVAADLLFGRSEG